MILSVPSYTIPGTYAENILFLADNDHIQGIELLFFSFDDDTSSLLNNEIHIISQFSDRFYFTVHLPDPLLMVHEILIATLEPYVHAFVMHPPKIISDESINLINRFMSTFSKPFLLENTKMDDFLNTRKYFPKIPICMDTGHLLLEKKSVSSFFEEYKEDISEIHLHGIANGKDHEIFSNDDMWFKDLKPHISEFKGVLNLEVFSLEKTNSILNVLKDIL